jgi:hypothetical protein
LKASLNDRRFIDALIANEHLSFSLPQLDLNELVMVLTAAFLIALFIEYPCLNLKKILFDQRKTVENVTITEIENRKDSKIEEKTSEKIE